MKTAFAFMLALTLTGCATKTHTLSTNAVAPRRASSSMIIRPTEIEPSGPPVVKSASMPSRIARNTHTVKAGETLWAISRQYGIDVNELAETNGIRGSGAIEVGQVLSIPVKSTHSFPRRSNYSPRSSGSFAWPVRGEIASSFGSKVDKSVSKGVDIRADGGANVLASRAGRVVYSDTKLKGFGHTVIIDHMDGYQTVYSYNSSITVKVGDVVEQSDVIAKVGSSGRASGNMLHFEIRKNGEPQNPEFYLSRIR